MAEKAPEFLEFTKNKLSLDDRRLELIPGREDEGTVLGEGLGGWTI